MFEEEGHVSGSESGEEERDGGRIGTSPIPSVYRASSPVTKPAASETGAMSIQAMLERLMSEITAQRADMKRQLDDNKKLGIKITAQGAEMANQFVTQGAEMGNGESIIGDTEGRNDRSIRVNGGTVGCTD